MQPTPTISALGAPPLPPGWMAGPPDYVGVGAACSGATWWHRLVSSHPSIVRMPGSPAAVHFFDDLFEGEPDEARAAAYHAYFGRPAEDSVTGEWTPSYMLDVWTPALLRASAPEARLLVLLRDPVECFDSGPADEEDGQDDAPTVRAAANASFFRGLYADQLLRLWDAFPREQVLVLQYERCRADPHSQLQRTFAFLGLDPAATAGLDLSANTDRSRPPMRTLEPWQGPMLARRYAPENERLSNMLPDLDLSLWTAPA